MGKMTFFRSYILTAILALVFLAVAFSGIKTFRSYSVQKQKANTLAIKLRLYKQELKEKERKLRILSRVNAFVDRAEKLGLTEDRWSIYNVNISEPVTFDGMEQILNACSHSRKYFFKPAMFHVQKAETDRATREQKPSTSTSADSMDTVEADLFLSLKGAFVVRDR